MKAVAQQYIDLGIVVIPLSKSGDGKFPTIKDWDEIKFKADDFGPENNIGMNIGLSKVGFTFLFVGFKTKKKNISPYYVRVFTSDQKQ